MLYVIEAALFAAIIVLYILYQREAALDQAQSAWWEGFVSGREVGSEVGYDEGWDDCLNRMFSWDSARDDEEVEKARDYTGSLVPEQELAAMGLDREPGPGSL